MYFQVLTFEHSFEVPFEVTEQASDANSTTSDTELLRRWISTGAR